ncbi:MAG: hypothetical protein V4673_09315 [Pseudomonadota bacterium]
MTAASPESLTRHSIEEARHGHIRAGLRLPIETAAARRRTESDARG